MEQVNVVLTGKLLPGTDLALAIQQLAAMTTLDSATLERLLTSGQATVVKRGVSPEVAEQYRTALTGIGVAVTVETGAATPGADTASSATTPPAPSSTRTS